MDFNIIELVFGVGEKLSSTKSTMELLDFGIMILIIIAITFIKEKSDSTNGRLPFNKDEFLYEILIGVMASILTVYGTQINIVLSSVIGAIIGIIVHDKLFKSPSTPQPVVQEESNNEKLAIENRLQLLRDKEYYDILDILLIYEYISFNQYDKVVKTFLYNTPDEMVDKLKMFPALTEAESKEARALVNFIRIKGRLATKQELIEFIEQNNKE